MKDVQGGNKAWGCEGGGGGELVHSGTPPHTHIHTCLWGHTPNATAGGIQGALIAFQMFSCPSAPDSVPHPHPPQTPTDRHTPAPQPPHPTHILISATADSEGVKGMKLCKNTCNHHLQRLDLAGESCDC